MKLPPDYRLTSLKDLRMAVHVLTGDPTFLEMTKEQYGKYKELLWAADFVRYYQGMEIKLSTEDATKAGDGSV